MRPFNLGKRQKPSNIETEFLNSTVDYYHTVSTDELKLPSLGFQTEEDAQLIVAAAKAMKAHGIEFRESAIKYIFQILGIRNEWTEE